MKTRPFSFAAALGSVLAMLTACDEVVVPTDTTQPRPVVPAVPAVVEFPPVSEGALVYDRVSASMFANTSRYVLAADGTFALQYVLSGFFEYAGRYSRADSVITFDFNDWNAAGPWQAGGTFRGDSLVVEYNIVMMFADFEDGVYVRSADP
jgi:hypothetical protein